jgi:hypothetical protein
MVQKYPGRSVMNRTPRSVSSGCAMRAARPNAITLDRRSALVISSTWKQTSWLAADFYSYEC